MTDTTNPSVAIVMGSDSDYETVKPAIQCLEDFNISAEVRVLSAHRTPDELSKYVSDLENRQIKVVIAAAGLSAALPGTIAAHTTLPVIGIPIPAGTLGGMDALLAISQMPPGVPVATTTIGTPGAKNAAILALRILALENETLKSQLHDFAQNQKQKVLKKDSKIKNS